VIRLRYIFRNEDESTWDAALVDVAEMMMQSKLAYAVTGSTSLRDSLAQEAAFLLKQAKAVDGQEEPPEELAAIQLMSRGSDMRANLIKTNFTAGEVSPRLMGRVDIARYANGAKIIENAVVVVQGGVVRDQAPALRRPRNSAIKNPA
jgi:hypothetical protein